MLKVKHSCIELPLLTKRGLETLNRSWIRSQTSGEVQPPCDPKNFDDCNQRSSKWWSSLMITEESSWQSSMWNKCDSSVLSYLDAKITQKKAQKPTWLARGWQLILHDNARPHLGKGETDLLSKYEWEALSHAPYSPDMSPLDFNLFHKLKSPCVDPVFPPWKRFLQRLPSHPRTEQKGYPKWNSKSSGMLGPGHWGAGGLHRRNKKILPKIKYMCK